MIKSKRQFGVEIEFIAPNRKSYDSIRANHRVEFDGSLRPHRWGGEYVSVPLIGRAGENEISSVCASLKKNKADVENKQTSIHVHLDGKKNEGKLRYSSKRLPDKRLMLGISNKVRGKLPEGSILAILRGDFFAVDPTLNITHIDNVQYISKGAITRHPRMNYRYYYYDKEDRLPWLRNMFYFYTQYTNVMNALVSRSRKVNNMYCIPLNDSFLLEEIESIKTMDDFIDVWYKGNGIGGHYDDSRYHNVNFHSFFNRHGTVEIRSHGGTTDANKILLWVRLHQHIADKLESMTLDQIKFEGDEFNSFLEFISDDPLLVDYCKRLMGYLSGVTIRNKKAIIKDVVNQ